jgi:hypothetical protein
MGERVRPGTKKKLPNAALFESFQQNHGCCSNHNWWEFWCLPAGEPKSSPMLNPLLTRQIKKSTKNFHNLKIFATEMQLACADNAPPQGKRTLEDLSTCGQKGDNSLEHLVCQ